jgi:hypothetical protein
MVKEAAAARFFRAAVAVSAASALAFAFKMAGMLDEGRRIDGADAQWEFVEAHEKRFVRAMNAGSAFELDDFDD